jgi:hypothetical protein
LELTEKLIAYWFIQHAIGEEEVFNHFSGETLKEAINRFETGEWNFVRTYEKRKQELMEEYKRKNLNPFGGIIEKGGVWEGWWASH